MWNQVEDALNESAARVLTGAATLLPGAIALVIAVLLAALVGAVLGFLLRRVLRGIDFDRRVAVWGWSGSGAGAPTLLLARMASWLVIFVGFMIGLAAFDPTLTSQLILQLFGSAMNLVTALVILVIGNVAAVFASRSVLISLVNMNVLSARFLSLGVKWLVLVMTIAMALDHLSIGGRIVDLAFGILFGGIVLSLSLAVGLRSRDLANWSLAQQPQSHPEEESDEPVRHL